MKKKSVWEWPSTKSSRCRGTFGKRGLSGIRCQQPSKTKSNQGSFDLIAKHAGGPDWGNTPLRVLIRFKRESAAVSPLKCSADVAYEDHYDYQQFLWYNDNNFDYNDTIEFRRRIVTITMSGTYFYMYISLDTHVSISIHICIQLSNTVQFGHTFLFNEFPFF